jgi:hypothetical protein
VQTYSIGISGFLRYLNSTPLLRESIAASLRDPSPWSPAQDYWLYMKNALLKDRRTLRDGTAMENAAAKAIPKRTKNYQIAAASWRQVAPRWAACRKGKLDPQTVTVGGLEVSVRPTFVEVSPSGQEEAVFVWFNQAPLVDAAEKSVLLLARRAYPWARASVVDLGKGRGTCHIASAQRLARYNAWLQSEAAGLAHLLGTES